jgi:hypothetical protein
MMTMMMMMILTTDHTRPDGAIHFVFEGGGGEVSVNFNSSFVNLLNILVHQLAQPTEFYTEYRNYFYFNSRSNRLTDTVRKDSFTQRRHCHLTGTILRRSAST